MIRTTRCALCTGLVAVSVALLTGCGETVSGAAASSTTSTSTSSPAAPAESEPTKIPLADPTATNERSAGSGQPPRCVEANLAGVIDPGEAPNVDTFNSAIVVINQSQTVCTIQGFSELEWHTGGNGSTLPIETVRLADPAELVTLGPGEQAAFSMMVTMDGDGARTDCYEGASYAYVTLPGTDELIEVWMPDRTMGLPAVCAPIEITAWGKGTTPGAPW